MRFAYINIHTTTAALPATPRQYHQETGRYFTCRVVVERSQFGGQYVLDPVQNPVARFVVCTFVSCGQIPSQDLRIYKPLPEL
ncbi:hypothetical protein ILYODFUR_001296 [Ilyodon furcidens]|uniref:Uncharacterized protein n=1 Tax=Ilyodon furcidens TaxID=33524 RepID=A0ABV0V2Y7_9TELE